MSNLVVSERFDVLAEEFNQHDQQAGQSFVMMLNTQEEAKLEYQERTGKVHGFNDAWAEATGKSKETIKNYNWLAKNTTELRKKCASVHFSNLLSRDLMREYVKASPEAQQVTQELIEQGEKLTPRDIKELDADIPFVRDDVQESMAEYASETPSVAVNEPIAIPTKEEAARSLRMSDGGYKPHMEMSVILGAAMGMAEHEELRDLDDAGFAAMLFTRCYYNAGQPVNPRLGKRNVKQIRSLAERLLAAIELVEQTPTLEQVV